MATVKPNEVIAAYHRLDGNKTAVAEELGLHRDTVRKMLREAGIDKPLHGGRAEYMEPNVKPLPAKGKVKRYLLTSAQNNTKVHGRFLENLEAYADYVDAEIMVSRISYNKNAYQGKSVKPGRGPTAEDMADLWFDPKIEKYVCDDPVVHGSCQWQLAPTLLWCAEMNTQPTAERPLSGLYTYSRQSSGIFPHAKIAMESVPVAKGEDPKFIYTTGSVTHRNYIQKKAGLKADFHHAYGALIAEVNSDGEWWVRQINCSGKGSFYEIPAGADGTLLVEDGEVYADQGVAGINWGDVHTAEIDPVALAANWGVGGILDTLRPQVQFMHDVFSMRSRSHHDMRAFGKMYQKFLDGIDSVEAEVAETAALLHTAARDWCNTVVVNSNHDRHGERWLDEEDYRRDLLNSEFFLEAQLERVRSLRARSKDPSRTPWAFLEWALRRAQCPAKTVFLPRDASYIICKDKSGGIECGWHGDEGPNGSRGTTRGLVNSGRRVNKGHDHTATIMDGVYSAGACQRSFEYMHGPTSHSISHIITYPNGKRTIITLRNGKWRA